jgi:hypothetical protein
LKGSVRGNKVISFVVPQTIIMLHLHTRLFKAVSSVQFHLINLWKCFESSVKSQEFGRRYHHPHFIDDTTKEGGEK